LAVVGSSDNHIINQSVNQSINHEFVVGGLSIYNTARSTIDSV